MLNWLNGVAAALGRYLHPSTSPLWPPLRDAAQAAWPHLCYWAVVVHRAAGNLFIACIVLVNAGVVALVLGALTDPDGVWACYLLYLEAIGYTGTPEAHLCTRVLPSPHPGECLYFLMCPEMAVHWEYMVWTPTRDPRSWDMPWPSGLDLILQGRHCPMEAMFSDTVWHTAFFTLPWTFILYWVWVFLEHFAYAFWPWGWPALLALLWRYLRASMLALLWKIVAWASGISVGELVFWVALFRLLAFLRNGR